MGVRIGQERDERKQLDEGAGPAMGQDQRDAVSVFRPYMNEVNADAVELGLELIGRVQCALLRAPVKFVGPIRKQASQVIKIGPLFPGRAWCRIRPARVADALSKVRQSLCVDVDRERSDMWRDFHRRYRSMV